jgi:hypothetical protein
MAKLKIKYTFSDPRRKGACGEPAPIDVTEVGSGADAIAISPPVTISCATAAAMHDWLLGKVQPAARSTLRVPVVQMNTMSSYSCRNRNGAKKGPVSQHAFARAIDVRGFITAKGEILDVELHWGPTARETSAYTLAVASARAAAERAAAEAAAAQKAARARAAASASAPAVKDVSGAAYGATPSEGRPAIAGWTSNALVATPPPSLWPPTPTTVAPVATQAARVQPASFPVLPKSVPAHRELIRIERTGQLGKLGARPVEFGEPLDARANFLRSIHHAACGPFSTVLGPEADRNHRNHFHFDTAPRGGKTHCG